MIIPRTYTYRNNFQTIANYCNNCRFLQVLEISYYNVLKDTNHAHMTGFYGMFPNQYVFTTMTSGAVSTGPPELILILSYSYGMFYSKINMYSSTMSN